MHSLSHCYVHKRKINDETCVLCVSKREKKMICSHTKKHDRWQLFVKDVKMIEFKEYDEIVIIILTDIGG